MCKEYNEDDESYERDSVASSTVRGHLSCDDIALIRGFLYYCVTKDGKQSRSILTLQKIVPKL